MNHVLYNFLIDSGFSENAAKYTNLVVLIIAILIIILLIDYALRRVLVSSLSKLAVKSKTHFDDYLVKNKVPNNLAHIIPLFLAFQIAPRILTDFKPYIKYTDKGLQVLSIVLILAITRGLLNTLEDYFKSRPKLKDKPIDSYIQVFMIFAWAVGLLSIFAVLTGIPFLKFLTGLGAASAVILLIFKDTILGFVASIQVSINDMVHIGDWITFEKFGADGDVIEISLATVKVQNFDMTITTIPTYALISESFKNWRGMSQSGGRRIKRSLNVKQETIKFLSNEDIEKYKRIEVVREYIEHRQKDIARHNSDVNANKELLVNGRNLTNIGVFRKYIEHYIKHHPAINKDMTTMVRQLAPTSEGLPLEIYAFASDKRWENYEHIMADIFDHVLSSVSYFDLELFEYPNKNFVAQLK